MKARTSWLVAVFMLMAASGCLEKPDPDGDEDGVRQSKDCNDADATVYPGATEVCDDGVDQDCNGSDRTGDCSVKVDFDRDGHFSPESGGDDCDDFNSQIYPGAEERAYDGIDQNCDGQDLADVDGDGFDSDAVGGSDCADGDATIHPAASEVAYDGTDQDCDGQDLIDVDDDGFAAVVAGGPDCDDTSSAVHPQAEDVLADGVDADCDGVDGLDEDRDGFAAVEVGGTDCNDGDARIGPAVLEVSGNEVDENCDGRAGDVDADGQEALPWGTDCDDHNPAVKLGGEEVWGNDVDENCDGFASDVDKDGQLSIAENGMDCADTDPKRHAGALEDVRNGLDDDCNGEVDEIQAVDDATALLHGDESSLAGSALLSADFNGDGYPDLVVGAPGWPDGSGKAPGAIFLVPGSPAGFQDAALSGGYLIFGENTSDRLGSSLAVGDINGDGLPDILAGAPGALEGDTRPGKVYAIFGGNILPARVMARDAGPSFIGAQDGDAFGAGVAFVGDLDGDGRGDFMVGAPGNDALAEDAGCVYQFTGVSDVDAYLAEEIATARTYGSAEGAALGTFVTALGDVNGAGGPDLALSAPGFDQGRGEIEIHFRRDGGFTRGLTLFLEGSPAPSAGLGPVASGGDLNDDGIDDLVVSAPGGGSGRRGEVYFLPGSTRLGELGAQVGVAAIPGSVRVEGSSGSRFGEVLLAGRFFSNRAVLLVGDPQENGGAGVVHLFDLEQVISGAASTPWAIWSGNKSNQEAGSALCLQDFDLDGVTDLAIGAPGDYGSGEKAGAVFTWLEY